MFNNSMAQKWKTRLKRVFNKAELDEAAFEELLFQADFSFELVEELLQGLKDFSGLNEDDYIKHLKKLLVEKIQALHETPIEIKKPFCIMMLGINGVGKTTSVARIAHYYKQKGHAVVLAAADTFRAGAVDQIKLWADRVGVHLVSQGMGADPASVVYDAWSYAKQNNAILIADTAGRMHTKGPLMEQLQKMIRVLQKDNENLPHESWLVLDGTTGQNAYIQSKEFAKASNLTGIIASKMDGSAKGGAILGSALDLNVPIRFVGTGEGVDNIYPFDSEAFIDQMIDA